MNKIQELSATPSWFVRRDIDGFVGLALDNFVQILVVISLTQGVLKFPAALVYGRILPGIAISLIVGNFYYSWIAYQLGRQHSRADVTALPYGISTISLFAYIFLVMQPVQLDALAGGATPEQAAEVAWQAGIVACLGSGLIECCGAFMAKHVRSITPRVALLSTLGGIALGFISLNFLLRTYAHPLIALIPLGVILLTYGGHVDFRIPGGILAILLGTLLAWGTGVNVWSTEQFNIALEPINFYIPHLYLDSLWQARSVLLRFMSTIFPISLFNLIASLQNLESAEASGDRFPTTSCLVASGIGSIVAAGFGSCFPTAIYMGHPGWKEMGARIGYSWLNGLILGFLCLTGMVSILHYLIPIESGMAILLWIGIVIVAQGFTASPGKHAPAVVIGILPGIASWGSLIARNVLRAAGMGSPQNPLTPDLISAFEASNIYVSGAFALEQGLIFSAMSLSAMTVHIIEGEFNKAACWTLALAAFSWFGLVHSYRWTTSDIVMSFGWGAGSEWTVSYLLLTILMLYAHWQQIHRG